MYKSHLAKSSIRPLVRTRRRTARGTASSLGAGVITPAKNGYFRATLHIFFPKFPCKEIATKKKESDWPEMEEREKHSSQTFFFSAKEAVELGRLLIHEIPHNS